MGKKDFIMPKISVIPVYDKLRLNEPRKAGVKRLDKGASFMRTLKPVLLSLVVVGIQTTAIFKPSVLREKSLNIKWWNIVALIYLHLFSIKAFTTVVLTSGGLGFWMQMTTFVRSSVATISADIYISKRNKLHLFIHNMSYVYNRFGVGERKKFKKRVDRHIFVLWLFMALNAIMMIVNVYKLGMEKFLDVHFFSARVSFVSPTSQYVIGSILLMIRQSIMWGTLSFMVMLYVILCEGIKYSFKSFNQNLIQAFQNPTKLDETHVKQLQQQYVYIVDLVSQMDDIFSPVVFFWSSAFIISVCIDITFDIALYGRMDTVSFLESVQKIIFLLLAYFAVGLSAALAMEEGQRSLPIFHKATASFDASGNVSLSQSVQFFAIKLGSTQLALTGWKFFELSRSYMLTLFGILGSYMILVFQFNPHVMASLINGSNDG